MIAVKRSTLLQAAPIRYPGTPTAETFIQEITMRTKPTRMLVLGFAFVVSACGSDTDDTSSTQDGGSVGAGGSVEGTGGTAGSATGGSGANPTGGSGAGGTATGGTATGGEATGGAPPVPFELQGSWLYLGPWDEVHTLEISNASVVYTDIDGEWSSSWTIREYDNELHHFQLTFESGTGTYSPVGQDISGAYVLAGAILTVQLAEGLGYPPVESPSSCTDGDGNRIPDCGLYMSQN